MVVEADTREVCLHGATPSLECIFPRRLSRVTYSFICALVPCVRGFFNIYESPRLLFFFQFLNRFFFFFRSCCFFAVVVVDVLSPLIFGDELGRLPRSRTLFFFFFFFFSFRLTDSVKVITNNQGRKRQLYPRACLLLLCCLSISLRKEERKEHR